MVPAVEELYRKLTNTGELTLEELPDLDLYICLLYTSTYKHAFIMGCFQVLAPEREVPGISAST